LEDRKLPAVADHSITFAIGDEILEALLAACDAFRGSRSACFIFLGDYIDRGPLSKGVVELLIKGGGKRDRDFVCLRGNHEEMLIRAADRDRSDRDFMTWWANGGEATLESYGVDDPSDLPVDHLAWLRSLPLKTSDHHRMFVHAGIRPRISLSSQSDEDLLWIREPFLSSEEDHGILVVLRHTPTRNQKPDLRPNRVNIDTGACFGGPLTAAVFSDKERPALSFINDTGKIAIPGE
jgi:serine/threonine protein phosphatase 1